jgi:hypothetical protein
MAKRRATLRGRGAEILFGEPAPPEVEPRLPQPEPADIEISQPEDSEGRAAAQPARSDEPSSSPPAEVQAWFDEVDLERALEEEARAAEPGPEEDEEEILMEEDLANLEEELMASGSQGTVTRIAMPSAAGSVERFDEVAAMRQPPPPEVSDLIGGVLPPGERDIQEPVEIVEPIVLPDRELTEEERVQILAVLGEERLLELEKAIDEAYQEVRLKVGTSEEITTDCYNKLLKARDIVVRRDAAMIAQAEYYIELVQARLSRAADSDAAARKYQWPILIWGLFWCAVLLSLLVLLNETWFQEIIASYGLGSTWLDMDVFLSTMIWGGVGGVVAVLYSLFKHVGRRDFDRHYNLSYLGKPFLGLILGATTFMVYNLALRTLGIFPLGVDEDLQVTATTVAPGVMYLMAWAGGFKENQIFGLVDRAMKRIFGGGDAR